MHMLAVWSPFVCSLEKEEFDDIPMPGHIFADLFGEPCLKEM